MFIGFPAALGLLFVALKLLGAISWSWWLVLMPFYLGIALVSAFLLFAIGLDAIDGVRRKRK